jgi:hypothetical protein
VSRSAIASSADPIDEQDGPTAVTTPPPDPPTSGSAVASLFEIRALQFAALTVFLVVIGFIAYRLKFSVLDPDLWWHLKVGDWIVEHSAVPHTGILSRTAADRPWVAYSWGYEFLLSRAYAWFGLMGIGGFGTLLTVLVGFAVYWMARRLSHNFWIAFVAASLACWGFLFTGMPRPFFFSIALYCVTLAFLLQASRDGRVEILYWLPPLFALWANLHIQFVYGLAVVGLFGVVHIALRAASAFGVLPEFLASSKLATAKLILVCLACVAATLLGPNFYHPYTAVLAYSKSKFAYQVIIELQALSFRGSSHYVELLLAAAAFFAVGWQKKIDLFKLALLVLTSVVAFRTMRDAWFVCVSAAACLADLPEIRVKPDQRERWFELAGVAAAAALLLMILAGPAGFTPRDLDRTISGQYPVNAINFLRRNPQPGPIYNNLNWGGFLMWYMPEYPVAIDGRNDLYGDELDKLFYDTQSAMGSYKTDPYLNQAGVVLLDSEVPLAKILTVDPRFQLVYHDQIATVFARR